MTNARDAFNDINNLAAHSDNHNFATRELLIDTDAATRADLAYEYAIPADEIDAIADAIDALAADPYARDLLTDLLLSYSLCPLHRIDYAICFDDETAECAAIRIIHPSHDT